MEFNKGKRDINKKGKGLNREGDSGSKGGNVIEGVGLNRKGCKQNRRRYLKEGGRRLNREEGDIT